MGMQPFVLALQETNKSIAVILDFLVLCQVVLNKCHSTTNFRPCIQHLSSIKRTALTKQFFTLLSVLITDLMSVWATDHTNGIYAYLEEIVLSYALTKDNLSTACDLPVAQNLIQDIVSLKDS